jgi:hypothetical protein
MKNSSGLSRHIPESIKREVRQRSGFGCVFCGLTLVEYEHVDPTFSEATMHDAGAITLLCPTCHAKVTRGLTAKTLVKQAMASPRCKEQGFSFLELGGPTEAPIIMFGGSVFSNCPVPVAVQGVPVVRFDSPEVPGGPYRISASFVDEKGNPSLSISENEWVTSSLYWDVRLQGNVLTIRSSPEVVALQLRYLGNRVIEVANMQMSVQGFLIKSDVNSMSVAPPGGVPHQFSGHTVSYCPVGLHVTKDGYGFGGPALR